MGGIVGFLIGFCWVGWWYKKLVEMFFNVVFWVDKFVVYYVLLCIVIMILGEDELFDIVELFE